MKRRLVNDRCNGAFFCGCVCLFILWSIFFCPQVRSGCAFMVHVCQDEHQLYNEFFSKPTPKLEWVTCLVWNINHTTPACLYRFGIEKSVQPQFKSQMNNLIQGAEVNFWCYYPTYWSNTVIYETRQSNFDVFLWIWLAHCSVSRSLHFYLLRHVVIFWLMVFRRNSFL